MASPPIASSSISSPPSGRPRELAPESRLDALDFAKGVLVVLMVVYHSLNYSTDYRLPFRYLAFLPPSFILISGFLLSHVYLARRRGRLLTRGAKLFALFVLLNVASHFVRSKNYHGPSRGFDTLVDAWPDIFLIGGSRLATFDVLLPIAYLLLLAPALLWLAQHHRVLFAVVTVLWLAACATLGRAGTPLPNAEFVGVGLVGLFIGLLPLAAFRHATRLLPVALGLYLALFLFAQRAGLSFLLQLAAAFLALLIFFGLGRLCTRSSWLYRRLLVAGQYSLVAYIGQIAFLQLYSHLAGRPPPGSPDLLFMFAAALAFTVALVETTRWLKNRSSLVDRLYRFALP